MGYHTCDAGICAATGGCYIPAAAHMDVKNLRISKEPSGKAKSSRYTAAFATGSYTRLVKALQTNTGRIVNGLRQRKQFATNFSYFLSTNSTSQVPAPLHILAGRDAKIAERDTVTALTQPLP